MHIARGYCSRRKHHDVVTCPWEQKPGPWIPLGAPQNTARAQSASLHCIMPFPMPDCTAAATKPSGGSAPTEIHPITVTA